MKKSKMTKKPIAAKKLRKDDLVVIMVGKDKGKQGKLLEVKSRSKGVLVEGLNMVTKAVKPNPNAGVTGGFKKQESYVDISNVAYVNPNTNKPDKIGFKITEDGHKVRFCKSDNHVIDDGNK